jgi:hypothetical protein
MEDNKQYLLFVFDNLKDRDELIRVSSLQLSNFISEGTFLKYNYGDYGIVFYFESSFSFMNLREHIQIIFDKVFYQFFLMEAPKNLYVNMPYEMKLNLFDLYSENNFKEPEKEEEKGSNFENIFYRLTSTFNENLNAFVFDESGMTMFMADDEEFEKPTIDQLLDKIQETGLKSLTNYEKQLLDEYSKSQG